MICILAHGVGLDVAIPVLLFFGLAVVLGIIGCVYIRFSKTGKGGIILGLTTIILSLVSIWVFLYMNSDSFAEIWDTISLLPTALPILVIPIVLGMLIIAAAMWKRKGGRAG